jgi:hypothetical protein
MTYNRCRIMLILNLKHGFNIVGLLADKAGEPKIILEKNLALIPYSSSPCPLVNSACNV